MFLHFYLWLSIVIFINTIPINSVYFYFFIVHLASHKSHQATQLQVFSFSVQVQNNAKKKLFVRETCLLLSSSS